MRSASELSPFLDGTRVKMNIVRSDELLTTAAFRGETERVREMLSHGAMSSARSDLKTTALHWAVSMGHVDTARVLVEHGADVDARSADGNSPLHVAAREGDAATAELLIESGANPVLCNSAGATPLDLALEYADDEVELVHLLRTAKRSHEERRLTQGGTAISAAPSPATATLASNSGGSSSKAVMVSSGCGDDEPLPVDGPLRADLPDYAPLPAERKPRMVSGGCGGDDSGGIVLCFSSAGGGGSGGGNSVSSGALGTSSSSSSAGTFSGGEGRSFLPPAPPPVPLPPPAAPAVAGGLVAAFDALGLVNSGATGSMSTTSVADLNQLDEDESPRMPPAVKTAADIDGARLASLASAMGF